MVASDIARTKVKMQNLFAYRAPHKRMPVLFRASHETVAAVKRGDVPGLYLFPDGHGVVVHDLRWMGQSEQLVTEAYPARLFAEASRGIARLPLNAAAKDLLGIAVRGPVCVMAPEVRVEKAVEEETKVVCARPIPVPAYFLGDDTPVSSV